MQRELFPIRLGFPTLAKRRADSWSKEFRTSPTSEVGQAAEHLVCADLLLNGWTAYLAGPSVPYDIVVETGDARVRVQVKSTLLPTTNRAARRVTPAYFFCLNSRLGKRLPRYGHSEVDIFALVALDRKLIAYFAVDEIPKQQVALRVPGLCYGSSGKVARDFVGASFERSLTILLARKMVSGNDSIDASGSGELFTADAQTESVLEDTR